MIGTTIAHYKILEKLGEVRSLPTIAAQRVVEHFSIPLCEAKAGVDNLRKLRP